MTDKVKAYIEELRRDNCLSADDMGVNGLCVEANPCSSCVTHFALLFAVEEHEEDKDGWCKRCWNSSGWPIKFPCDEYKGIAEIMGVTL